MSTEVSNLEDEAAKPAANDDNKNVPWYTADEDVPELDPRAYEIFANYSHIPPDTIRAHVLKKVSNMPAVALSKN